jgi:hypothetical protein
MLIICKYVATAHLPPTVSGLTNRGIRWSPFKARQRDTLRLDAASHASALCKPNEHQICVITDALTFSVVTLFTVVLPLYK